jgi:hypothetical protein
VGGGDRCRVGGAVTARETTFIARLTDTARFRPDDPDALVHASLACPICLCSEDVQWEASLQGYDPSVQCRCPSCSQKWRVYLAPDQALRLGLMPVHVA